MTTITTCTESEVQARIMFEKGGSSTIMLPNYTPGLWWENDIFQVTKAGYWVEYEVKRSVADYKADFRKREAWGGYSHNKHELLASGQGEFTFDPYAGQPIGGKYPRIMKLPNRFYFCIPVELVDKIDPPEYAGLITFDRERWRKRGAPADSEPELGRVFYRQVKPAPLIHKVKHGFSIVRPAMAAGQSRYVFSFMKQHIEGLT